MKIIVSVLSLCLSSFLVFAQNDLESYNKARQMMSQGEYVQAMEILSPYMNEETYGELSRYSRFHFARAAYANRQFELAKNALEPLMTDRAWKQQDEVRYLMALVHFQQSKPNDALKLIADIHNEEILEEAYKATYEFLKVSSASVLMVQVDQYEENLGLVMALKDQLEKQGSLSSKEKATYQRIREMALSGSKEETEREVNQTLDIAILLPFNYNGGTGVRGLNSNNFVLQLYQGMQMALENARKEGLALDIRTFDTERSPERIKNILNDPFFAKADIILGPIYPEETEVVAAFSESYKIPFINPLSNVNQNLNDFEYSYLFRPSIRSISEKVIDYSNRFGGKRIAVAYSGTTRDELLAESFAEMARRSGFQIVRNEKVTTRSMQGFFENIRLVGNQKPLVDLMVIFSDDPNIASPTFAMVESLSSSIPVVVMDSWLYFNFASYEMMEAQNFHFIGNNTVSLGRPEIEGFREAYYQKYKSYPALNAYLGFELANWVSRVINPRSGFDLQKNLAQTGYIDGKLTFGFDFSQSRYNNFVPILRLEEGVLEQE